MEAVTAGADARHARGTGSKTIADLLPLAVEKYGDAPAQRFKVGEEWAGERTGRREPIGFHRLLSSGAPRSRPGLEPGSMGRCDVCRIGGLVGHARPEETASTLRALVAVAAMAIAHRTQA